MAIINCAECGNAFSDKASACPHCGCPIEFARPQPTNNEATYQSTSSADNLQRILLRDYLENVRALETDIYTMNSIISNLQIMDKAYPKKRTFTVPVEPKYPHIWPMEEIPSVGDVAKRNLTLDNLRRCPTWAIRSTIDAAKAVKDYENGTHRFHDINKRRMEINERNLKKYDEQMREYERLLIEYKTNVEEEEKQYKRICMEVDIYNQGIKGQIAHIVEERDHTQNALQALYDTEIIFPKYRGIVPVTMFCEYMDSGRRAELGGVHGMYDLYESELLGKRIVDSISQVNESLKCISYQLNDIASQLSGIARNQIMLHEEIARGNAISAKISMDTSTLLEHSASMLAATGKIHDELKSIHKTAQITEANTATAAYTAEVTARRVDAIARIEEYEYSLRHPMFPSV